MWPGKNAGTGPPYREVRRSTRATYAARDGRLGNPERLVERSQTAGVPDRTLPKAALGLATQRAVRASVTDRDPQGLRPALLKRPSPGSSTVPSGGR
jgi:hypothetical protein